MIQSGQTSWERACVCRQTWHQPPWLPHIQALAFMETGSTWVPVQPWQHGSARGRVVTTEALLRPGVVQHLTRLRGAAAASAAAEGKQLVAAVAAQAS